MKRNRSRAAVLFWVFEGLMCAAALGILIWLGIAWGDGHAAFYMAQIPLHIGILAGAVRLVIAGLRRKTKIKKPARALMAAAGLAVIFLLTVFGGILPFQTDEKTASLLAQTHEMCADRCAETGFTGTGMIYNDQVAEIRLSAVYRLSSDEAAAKKAYRRLAGDLWNGSCAPLNLLPFAHRRLPMENGWALISPVIASRLGTVPVGGEYLGYVLLHAGTENYCVEYVMHSEFALGHLFCAGPEERSLTVLTRRILEEPGSFLLSPTDDITLR